MILHNACQSFLLCTINDPRTDRHSVNLVRENVVGILIQKVVYFPINSLCIRQESGPTMKFQRLVIVLLPAVLTLSGCGKSDEEKNIESLLHQKISRNHETTMGRMTSVDALLTDIASTITREDSLATVAAGKAQLDRSDLLSARMLLEASRDSMTSWMADYRPVPDEYKHAVAMAMMQKQLTSLTSVDSLMTSALDAAHKALDARNEQGTSSAAQPGGR
jgi:hypothetical protein